MSPILPVERLCAVSTAPMSTFSPAGAGAAASVHVTWILVILATVIFIAVMIAMWIAVRRGQRPRYPTPPRGPAEEVTRGGPAETPSDVPVDLTPRSDMPVLLLGATLPAIVLVALYVIGVTGLPSARGETATHVLPTAARAPYVQVVGHQWWWEIVYHDANGVEVRTANELHVPVGQPVVVQLLSGDVIHSFWVPRLQGKVDLIPGDTNTVRIVATQAGAFRGTCAEFCGDEHARMPIIVVAEPPAQFASWFAAQAADAAMPTDPAAIQGAQLVTTGPCALCHAIRGSAAHGDVAPDLTHVGSRRLLGGAVPNTPTTMTAWITNAQLLKPGTRMPAMTQFTGPELRAISAYLETLR